MEEKPRARAGMPTSPLRVSICRESGHEADAAGTKALLDAYTKEDGFHCPRCGEIFTNPDKAIEHLADEINRAFLSLP
ncbi:hypothetical protein ES708_14065 [subsurface metagenome]